MRLGRDIPYYSAFLIAHEPVQLPPNVVLVEREDPPAPQVQWSHTATKKLVKTALAQQGFHNVRCQSQAIDVLSQAQNAWLLNASVRVCHILLQTGHHGRSFALVHVQIAQAFQGIAQAPQ